MWPSMRPVTIVKEAQHQRTAHKGKQSVIPTVVSMLLQVGTVCAVPSKPQPLPPSAHETARLDHTWVQRVPKLHAEF